jgi:hypothetical protein
VQDVRHERGFAVVFSMGNFIFDNPTLDRRQSMIFLATLMKVGPMRWVDKVEVEPVMIEKKIRHPVLAQHPHPEAKKWRKRLATLLGPGVIMRADPNAPPEPPPEEKPAEKKPAKKKKAKADK